MNSLPWPDALRGPKARLLRLAIVLAVISWMAVYPIYCSYYKANAVDHYRRHLAHVAGNSMFFNPWQYRVLCPLMIEGTYWVFDHTVFALVPVKGIDLGLPGDKGDKNEVTRILIDNLKDPEFIKYTVVFLLFRFAQNVLLILLCFRYFSHFVKNKLLIVLGLLMAVLFMGNGVVDSDLTFNTYMDVTLYILAGLVLVNGYSAWWILLLTIAGALNRETALFIPVLYFFHQFKWAKWPDIVALFKANLNVIGLTAVCVVFFFGIFISIRVYYGFQPVSSWRVSTGWPMLKLNLFSAVSVKTYMEQFGVVAFLPLWALFVIKKMNPHLRIFFLTLVPAWFAIHFISAIAYQTRLFLVPVLLVLLPAVLESIERYYEDAYGKGQPLKS